jgi:hypothetical protein
MDSETEVFGEAQLVFVPLFSEVQDAVTALERLALNVIVKADDVRAPVLVDVATEFLVGRTMV